MSVKRRLRTDDGLTLIEVLVAILLLSGGLVSTLSVLSSGHRTSAGSARSQQANQIAQAYLEKLSFVRTASEWSGLALKTTSPPTWEGDDGAANPTNPAAYLRGGAGTTYGFTACSPCTKFAVLQDPTDRTSAVPSGVTSPEDLVIDAAGTVASKVTLPASAGTVYQYVTIASDRRATVGATTFSPARRVIVAVVLASSASNTLTKPVWASTIVTDPAVTAQ